MNLSEIYTAYMYSYPHKTAYREIENINIEDRLRKLKSAGLYIHIPFCQSKCGYCNLFSVTGKNEDYMELYLNSVEKQISSFNLESMDISFDSVTIGGGTPLLLNIKQLENLFFIVNKLTGKEAYSCIETAPNQTTEDKLDVLKENKVNRVSIGAQSFVNSELASLGRNHSSDTAKNALKLIRDADFDNLNVDLIYGINNQTLESLRYSIDTALYYSPDEIFIYPLYIRKGTGIFNSGTISENTYEQYIFLRDYLFNKGYCQTSMRRFVKHPPENTGNCGFESTVSLGCGGRSYLNNLHICAPYSNNKTECAEIINNYIKNPEKPRLMGYILNTDEQKRRYLIKNLLHVSGIDEEDYTKHFNSSIIEDFPILTQLSDNNYAEISNKTIKLTTLGLSYSDYIGTLFISDEVKERMSWRA